MSSHVGDLREKLDNWLYVENAEKEINVEFLKKLVEFLGFSASYDDRAQANDVINTNGAKRLIITSLSAIQEGKTQENDIIVDVQVEAIVSPTPKIKSEIMSPQQYDVEISVDVPTSSPIKQHKFTDTLKRIMNLAKDALEHDANSTFTKPPFLHKRISDIKISPLALETHNSRNNHLPSELNVTRTKESPSVLKVTPKKKGAVIVKPDQKENERNTPTTLKRSLHQPMHSNLQALRSKLRTPTSIKSSTLGVGVTRSAGPPGRSGLPTSERRLSIGALKRETPLGFSRLKYPSTMRK